MDKKTIEKYGTDIFCYRLRTARQKKRMQYEDLDKRLMGLDREETALVKKHQKLGWEPLAPPLQKGWKRCFVLREDVAQSQHAEFFEGILKKINTYQYSSERTFLIKKRKMGRKIHVPRAQELLTPWDDHYRRLNFTATEKQFFHPEYEYSKGARTWFVSYVFNEPWRFVLKVSPNFIDKVRVIDPELESRMQVISDHIFRNGLNGRRVKLMRGRVYHNRSWKAEERQRERNLLRNKPLTRILDELKYDTFHA